MESNLSHVCTTDASDAASRYSRRSADDASDAHSSSSSAAAASISPPRPAAAFAFALRTRRAKSLTADNPATSSAGVAVPWNTLARYLSQSPPPCAAFSDAARSDNTPP